MQVVSNSCFQIIRRLDDELYRSRKIQDVFVTAKVPPALRAVLPLLVDADTREVLWVPGYRMSEAAAVESATAPSWRFTLSASEEAEEK